MLPKKCIGNRTESWSVTGQNYLLKNTVRVILWYTIHFTASAHLKNTVYSFIIHLIHLLPIFLWQSCLNKSSYLNNDWPISEEKNILWYVWFFCDPCRGLYHSIVYTHYNASLIWIAYLINLCITLKNNKFNKEQQ